jgi:hypothetical protein
VKISSCFRIDRLCGLVVGVPCYRSRCPGFDSRHYQIFWDVVGLERGPLSLVSIIEELLGRNVAAPVYKTEINGRGDSLRWPRDSLYPLKLALTSPQVYVAFTVLKCKLFLCFTLSLPHYMFRLHMAILRCESVDYCTAIILKINV